MALVGIKTAVTVVTIAIIVVCIAAIQNWFIPTVVTIAIIVVCIPAIQNWFIPFRNAEGWTAPGWEKVADTFRDLLKSNKRNGMSYSVYYKGEKVVDLWGGYVDLDKQEVWQERTMSQFYSSTKGACAIIVAMLVDRGYLDYEKPVAAYWPEFGQNGKDQMTLRTLLGHKGGLSTLDTPPSINTLFDTEVLGNMLAEQKPLWEPGTAQGYHGYTFGLYVDQIVRRADPKKRGIQQFFKEEIAEPFGIDFHIGLPLDQYYRVAKIHSPRLSDLVTGLLKNIPLLKLQLKMMTQTDTISSRSTQWPTLNLKTNMQWPSFYAFPFGSVNGFGHARDVAKLYGILFSGDKYKGKQLMSQKVLKMLTKTAQSMPDVVLATGVNVTLSLGFSQVNIPHGSKEYLSVGHAGYGGQVGLGYPSKDLGIGFVTNFLSVSMRLNDERFIALHQTTWECLEKFESKTK